MNVTLYILSNVPENTCSETLLGETAGGLNEKIMEHARKDNKSHMLKNLVIHQSLWIILEYFRKKNTFQKECNNKVKKKFLS